MIDDSFRVFRKSLFMERTSAELSSASLHGYGSWRGLCIFKFTVNNSSLRFLPADNDLEKRCLAVAVTVVCGWTHMGMERYSTSQLASVGGWKSDRILSSVSRGMKIEFRNAGRIQQ